MSKVSNEPGGQVPEPMSFDLQRKISTGHREFEEKALAVSNILTAYDLLLTCKALRRVSGDVDGSVPDVSSTVKSVQVEYSL